MVPSRAALLLVLRSCGKMKDVDKAFKVWKDYAELPEVRLDEKMHYTLIEACISAGDRERAASVLAMMKEKNITPSSRCYDALIGAYATLASAEAAFQTFLMMQQEGVKPTASIFAALIGACSDPKDPSAFERAMGVLPLMEAQQVEPNEAILNSLITLCLAHSRGNALSQVEAFIDKYQMKLGALTYDSLIQAFAKDNDSQQAYRLLERMVVENKLLPDGVTFNQVLKACMDAGDVKESLRVLDLMQQAGQTPGTISFTIVINACVKKGDLESAWGVLRKMRQYKVRPDEVTFLSLTNVCVEARELAKAFEVVEMMKKEGLRPNLATFNCLLKGCLRKVDLERGMTVLKMMKDEKVPADKLAFDYFMTIVGRTRHWEKAFDGVEWMEQAGMEVTSYEYETLHRMALKERDEDKALELMDRMKRFNAAHPAVVYKKE